jgi:hypothetical protein
MDWGDGPDASAFGWLREVVEPSGWEVVDDCTLSTCCGDLVEWDAPCCHECGSDNPLRALGVI